MSLLTMLLLLVPSAATAGPKLYLFDCGRIELESVEMFNLKEDETSVRELFVPCYLIRHDRGLLLWDGALPRSTAGKERVPLEGGGFTS